MRFKSLRWGIGGLFVCGALWALVFLSHRGGEGEGSSPSSQLSSVLDTPLTIAYDQPLTTYDPLISDVITRSYLVNVYEGLVRFDRNFRLEPALALSWGMLDDTTWQFKLRPGVTFHDGSSFEARDVVASLERAKADPLSQLKDLVSSIERIEVVDDYTLQFFTSRPDPILLNKLTAVAITPSEQTEFADQPMGSGPYRFVGVKDEPYSTWTFNRYENYWGEIPSHSVLHLVALPDKFKRYEAFVSGDVDVLAQVPPVFVNPLLKSGYPIARQPSLEVNFLLFGWPDPNASLRHLAVRQAIAHALDPEALIQFTSGFAHPVNQFVSRGVFGYNPALPDATYDMTLARTLLESVNKPIALTLDLPNGLESLGHYIQTQLAQLEVEVTLQFFSYEDYAARIQSGQSEFYFLGWRSDLGDAGDFFARVVHSQTSKGEYGTLNNGRYENESIDQLIESTEYNLLESERLQQLQDLMQWVVEKDQIGVPLFETDVLTAIQPGLIWEPRFDNFILATDVH
ncbi:MAG: hypothetical protein ACD_28C00082G0003 [uncultured bacterium]|nr:MAG: hypothetical protein ACD_28C00082G0003 [uncultured bacterium]